MQKADWKVYWIVSAYILIILCCFNNVLLGQSVSATYTLGNIPTNYPSYDPQCNGPNTKLEVQLPSNPGTYEVTKIDIEYDMTALSFYGGNINEQRSQVFCQNTSMLESQVYSSPNTSSGTHHYERQNVHIANGTYSENDILVFEMRAWRTDLGIFVGECSTSANRIDNGTWKITVYYDPVLPPKVGINNSSPNAVLDVAGKIKINDDVDTPEEGMIRYNNSLKDFEGYNGQYWYSLTGRNIPPQLNFPTKDTYTYPDSGSTWNLGPSNEIIIVIQFSQQIDPTTFVVGESFIVEGYAVATGSLVWNGDNTQVTFTSNEAYFDILSCSATVTLKGNGPQVIKNAKGIVFDGDGNGVPGQDFIFFLSYLC